jgi:hypothetical protein
MAFVAVWTVALDDAEMAALGKGYHPLMIRRPSLMMSADLTRTTQAHQGGLTITSLGLTVANNPRIIMPRGTRRRAFAAAAAPSTSIAAIMHSYRQRRI